MNRNSGELTLQETDTTDCSCMQLYSRNIRHNPTTRSSTLRSHQSHPRVNACARCRKRKPGNPKNPQHCPSCLCPPDVVKSSSGRLRGAENMEEVLSRFEEITRDPREPRESMQNVKGTLGNGKTVPIRSSPKKSSIINASRQQQRKSDHDQVLNALYQDLMSSGLATEETQNCRRYQLQQGPIKSVRNRKSNLIRTEQSPSRRTEIRNQEPLDVDSDAVLRYFRDYKDPKNPAENHKSGLVSKIVDRQKHCDPSRRREDDESNFEGATSKISDAVDDREKIQSEIDKRELKELSEEVRDYEMNKIKDCDDGGEMSTWENKLGRKLPSEDGDNQSNKRKVSFFASKLPVPMFTGNQLGTQNNRSRSPAGGDQMQDKLAESRTGNNSTSILDTNGHEEREERANRRFDYSNKESKDEYKDISYRHDPPYKSSSAPIQHVSETEDQTEAAGTRGMNGNREQFGDQLPSLGFLPKKYICGGGDLDLHASKSYIVDLIDRALSRELGTVIEGKKKGSESAVHQSQSQKEICVEIARALQGDNCGILGWNQNGNVHKEASEYVRHLKVLRWDYLNHIQEELKKLQDLERILDTFSPRQSSSTVPVNQFQPSTSEQKKNQQSIF